MQYLLSVLTFALILLILVLIHEAGHFFVAKFFKIKVEEFGFGLPPRLWGKKIGETIYSLNWIPAGGFVRLLGEDEDQLDKISDQKRSFAHQNTLVRGAVAVAGVLMNFFLTLVIFTIIYAIGGPIDTGRVYIGNIAPDSPAAQAGLKDGDIIAQIDGQLLKGPEDLRQRIYAKLGQPTKMIVIRASETFEVTLVPRQNPPEGQGALGVATANEIQKVKYPIWEAPVVGIQQAANLTGQTFQALGSAVTKLVTEQKAPEDLGGATRIIYFTHLAVKTGFDSVLILTGLLSLNLAIINILPLPALDGGRLFFILLELATRRQVSPKFEKWVHTSGFALLLLLIVFVTFNDIIWLLANTYVGSQIQNFFR